MSKISPKCSGPRPDLNQSRWIRLLLVGCVLIILLALFPRRPHDISPVDQAAMTNSAAVAGADALRVKPGFGRTRSAGATVAPTAEEIVAAKVLQFGRSRRDLVREIARRTGKNIPSAVEKFFDAIEAGDWKEIEAQWKNLADHSAQYEFSTEHWEDLDPFWPSVLDAYGVAEQAHDWPAQKLLDYGQTILDSLRPGMVYVGGTDPGRWIPELLNETSGGEPHIIITQNAFADGRYLEFMQTLYGDRFAALTKEDSKRAFDEYLADAQKRFQHDERFPDEPKQMRPDETIKIVDGHAQVSGQVSVMAVSEKLLQMLMEKNPDLSFAIEQSFPFKSTYGAATPIGPIMELGVHDEQNALTRERAAQSVDYWRATAQQLSTDAQADSEQVRMSYAKLALNQAALFSDRHFTTEAEQTYRIALEFAPSSREAVFTYVNLLTEQDRVAEAIPIAEKALQWSQAPERRTPENTADLEQKTRLYANLLKELKQKK